VPATPLTAVRMDKIGQSSFSYFEQELPTPEHFV
jgi:hypothetical protein